jgi:MFS family permease
LVYGLVAATYPAFQFVAAPVLGRWSDRYGRRRILLLSEIGTFLICAGIAYASFVLALRLPRIQPVSAP